MSLGTWGLFSSRDIESDPISLDIDCEDSRLSILHQKDQPTPRKVNNIGASTRLGYCHSSECRNRNMDLHAKRPAFPVHEPEPVPGPRRFYLEPWACGGRDIFARIVFPKGEFRNGKFPLRRISRIDPPFHSPFGRDNYLGPLIETNSHLLV